MGVRVSRTEDAGGLWDLEGSRRLASYLELRPMVTGSVREPIGRVGIKDSRVLGPRTGRFGNP